MVERFFFSLPLSVVILTSKLPLAALVASTLNVTGMLARQYFGFRPAPLTLMFPAVAGRSTTTCVAQKHIKMCYCTIKSYNTSDMYKYIFFFQLFANILHRCNQ